MTLGRLVYLLYHRPVSVLERSWREGGPLEQWRTENGRKQMESAAYGLPAPSQCEQSPVGNSSVPFEIHMVVGARFWFMAAFALASLQRHISGRLCCHFYDDGSLEAKQRDKLGASAAMVVFHDAAEIESRIEQHLPEADFPFIRERLRNYQNLKKLTHPHVGSSGAKLVVDADVLFFRQPTELREWCEAPGSLLCATDVVESYGYSRRLMEMLAGAPIPAKINVGITGLRSETLEWARIEAWCRELITREKTNYYLEQALVAMLSAGRLFTQLDEARYITGPADRQVLDGDGVMQHYVDLSKKEYFRNAWRRFTAPV